MKNGLRKEEIGHFREYFVFAHGLVASRLAAFARYYIPCSWFE